MSRSRFNFAKQFNRPKRNGDALFVKIKALFFGYYNKHNRQDLDTILMMLKTLERQNLCLDANQYKNMHSIVNNMRAKYEDFWGPCSRVRE